MAAMDVKHAIASSACNEIDARMVSILLSILFLAPSHPLLAASLPLPRQAIEVVQTDDRHHRWPDFLCQPTIDQTRVAISSADELSLPSMVVGSDRRLHRDAVHDTAPSIFVGVIETRSPSTKTWSRATGWRLTRIK